MQHWVSHAGMSLLTGLAVVMLAFGSVVPAVVLAGLSEVDFISASVSKLGLPDFAGHGMQRQPEWITIANGINLRQISRLAHERIVLWNGPVVANAQNLAEIG